MRRRLLVSSFLVAALAVLVLGVPLGIVATRLLGAEADRRVAATADRVARTLDDDLEAGRPIGARQLRALAGDHQAIEVVDRRGRRSTSGPLPGDGRRVTVEAADGARVTVLEEGEETSERIGGVWLTIVLAALVGLGGALALARREARRFAAPLEDLAAVARRMGDGDLDARARPSDLPEVDAVRLSLEDGAARLAEIVQRERAFSAAASHQLRTPLTALRLRLEDLQLRGTTPEVEAEIAAALTQADRLETTITDLLAIAREGRAARAQDLPLAPLVDEALAVRAAAFAAAGRTATVQDDAPGLVARVDRGALLQALGVLLDNALAHGGGAVRVQLLRRNDRPVIAVEDHGDGVDEPTAARIAAGAPGPHGSGLGLPLARALVEAQGGRLVLAVPRPARFELVLTPAGGVA
ncbi:HAMP domain-containing protein [Conexibacter sp. W3-3-2]|uniref:ATP-binding protein n=1 Tax=Conexibacter sp. W3-3-2 TaxID=2675227 RepID=UPI0012B7AC5C|nr:ATP-binding protein [Conexibacter sp. W3-3-2]MTD46579.1 HAMP domain-containing protein [Conexibacter sp. W3-3-2]